MPALILHNRSIHFREEGSGPPIILLHCSSSHSGQWKLWVPHLASFAHVMAPDFHGYGRSDALPKGFAWWQAEREIVPALAEYAGTKVHVIGHSLGGAAAVYAAMAHPEAVASLTLIEPVLFGLLRQLGCPEYADATMISEQIWGFLEQGERLAAAEAFTDFWSGPGAFQRLQPRQTAYIVETIERVSDDWRGLADGLSGQLKVSDIKSLDLPVHLIKGGKSRRSGQRIVDLLSEHLPRSDRTAIPEADHLGAVTHPDLFLPAIIAWLRPRLAP